MELMNYQSLLKSADFKKWSDMTVPIPSLPPNGNLILQKFAEAFPTGFVARMKEFVLRENVEISSYPHASSSWYGSRNIKALVWEGDLTIEGDLIDDDWESFPALIVTGNLSLRNWLRGGMCSFIGGHVQASGFIIGHYNDSALFAGGDLNAAGYIPRAKPYPEFRHIPPHQIAGRINARTVNAADEDLDASTLFVDEVLVTDEDGCIWFDEKMIFERVAANLPVWR